MRALITGGAGFVGRHMAMELIERGYRVEGCEIKVGQDCRKVLEADPGTHYDLVVHCAAVVGGRTMIDGQPLLLAAEDLSIDAALFRWALKVRPGRMVVFSSSAAYPRALQTCEHIRGLQEWQCDGSAPDQTYGWVKLTLERLAAEAELAGIRTHVFRPFSGYGADQALDYPFPAIIERARKHFDGGNFVVWGDPDSARDWVHIDDVVGCVLAAIDADDVGPMNICTGVATTFEQLATMVLDALGKTGEIVGDRTKPEGVFWRVGDPTRMRQVYTPRVTLGEGIERALAAVHA